MPYHNSTAIYPAYEQSHPMQHLKQALYHIIGIRLTNTPLYTISPSLAKHANKYALVIDVNHHAVQEVDEGATTQESVDQGHEQKTSSTSPRMAWHYQRY